MTSTSTPASESLELLDAKAVAQIAGVTVRTVQQWCHDGVMPPPMRIGPRVVRFSSEVIRDWVRNGCPAVGSKKGGKK